MPRRRPPKAEIIVYKQLKTAAGGGGSSGGGGGGSSGGGGGFWAGQNLVCRVVRDEPGGYAVFILKHNLPGFLPTQAILRTGEEILAQFVCIHNHRILLSARFSNNQPTIKPSRAIRWEEHLDEIDQEVEGLSVPPSGSEDERQNYIPSPPPIPIRSGTEAAFSVWFENTNPRSFHMKRATDLMIPPISAEYAVRINMEEYDLEWLITDLEGGARTCCVKASCESNKSRSSLLLYRGRVLGCIYGSRSTPDTRPTEESLQMMLTSLNFSDSEVEIYDLPESVVLAMSALFLGYPVYRNDDYDTRAYMDYICGWFEGKQLTACLAITLPSNASTCLAFVYRGQFCGAFYVEDQRFTTDREFVYQLFRNDPKANIEASILPSELTSSSVRFGFSLSVAKKRNDFQA